MTPGEPSKHPYCFFFSSYCHINQTVWQLPLILHKPNNHTERRYICPVNTGSNTNWMQPFLNKFTFRQRNACQTEKCKDPTSDKAANSHHPRADIEGLYLCRKLGGRGLLNIENLFSATYFCCPTT